LLRTKSNDELYNLYKSELVRRIRNERIPDLRNYSVYNTRFNLVDINLSP